MVGVRFYIYAMSDYHYEEVDILNFTTLVYPYAPTRFYMDVPYTYAELQAKDAQYGFKGRKIYSVRAGDSQVTYSKITGISVGTNGRGRLSLSDWSNQVPPSGVNAKCTAYEAENPLVQGGDIWDFSDYLIEDETFVVQKLESNSKFDLEASFGTIRLLNSGDVKTIFDEWWQPFDANGDPLIYGIEILKDGIPDFWACAKPEDITYDRINNEYIINCYDWYKYILDTIGINRCPYFNSLNLGKFLDIINLFGSKSIEVGTISQEISLADYNSKLINGGYYSIEEGTTVAQFLEELQKHYGAFIFFDKNKTLRFVNRNKYNGIININEIIVEDTFEKTYKLADYDKILLNVKGEWNELPNNAGWIQWEGWAFIWVVANTLRVQTGVDDAQIRDAKNYLDLRQNFYQSPIFDYILFNQRERSDVYNDYRELLTEAQTWKCSINTLNVDLLNRVSYNNQDYLILEVKKDYLNNISEIEIIQFYPYDYPTPFN